MGNKRPSYQELDPKIEQDISTNTQNLSEHLGDYVLHLGFGTTTSSTENSYEVSLNPIPIAYSDFMGVQIKIHTDSTGISTLNVNSLGARPIKKSNGSDIGSGDLKSGSIYTLKYNLDSGNFILQGEGGDDLDSTDKTNFINSANSLLDS